MPTTRSRGLSTTDLDSLRSAVEAGRKPKVVFTSAAGQIAGQTGQIIRFDDPASDEWVVVRFGRDELPFAPADLQLPPPKPPRPRPGTAKASTVPAGAPNAVVPATTENNGSAPVPTAASSSAAPVAVGTSAAPIAVGTSTAPVAVGTSAAAAGNTAARPVTAPATTRAAAARPAARTANNPVAPASPSTSAVNAGPAGARLSSAGPASAGLANTGLASAGATDAGSGNAGVGAKPKPARKPGAKKAPELTVTLGHHDGQWTVQASRGARVIVKPTSVRAADALKMVHLLESPAVAEAVDEIVAAARADAEDQAARLRRELAEVEAALADLSNDEA